MTRSTVHTRTNIRPTYGEQPQLRGIYDSQMWHKCVPVVLFLVDRGTNNFFFRLRSDVFYFESLFQTNHLVHLNTSRQGIFLVWRHDFFVLVLRDVHLQHVYLQEESSPS